MKKEDIKDFLIVCLYVMIWSTLAQNHWWCKNSVKQWWRSTRWQIWDWWSIFLVFELSNQRVKFSYRKKIYLEDLLKRFQMSNCKSISTPWVTNEKLQLDDGTTKVDAKIYRSLVSSLIYLTNTRPDIIYLISLVSRVMHDPSKF